MDRANAIIDDNLSCASCLVPGSGNTKDFFEKVWDYQVKNTTLRFLLHLFMFLNDAKIRSEIGAGTLFSDRACFFAALR